jgi:hypothetical protein
MHFLPGQLKQHVVQAPRHLECHQLSNNLVERDHLRASFAPVVITIAHVDSPVIELLLANNCYAKRIQNISGATLTGNTHQR